MTWVLGQKPLNTLLISPFVSSTSARRLPYFPILKLSAIRWNRNFPKCAYGFDAVRTVKTDYPDTAHRRPVGQGLNFRGGSECFLEQEAAFRPMVPTVDGLVKRLRKLSIETVFPFGKARVSEEASYAAR